MHRSCELVQYISKNKNLWESLGCIMVNEAPQEVTRELMESLERILNVPLGIPLSTLGNLPRGSIHHDTPSALPQIVPFSTCMLRPNLLPIFIPLDTLNLAQQLHFELFKDF